MADHSPRDRFDWLLDVYKTDVCPLTAGGLVKVSTGTDVADLRMLPALVAHGIIFKPVGTRPDTVVGIERVTKYAKQQGS